MGHEMLDSGAVPSIADWLQASWRDFLRRWPVLVAAAGVGGAASIAGAFLPMLAAGLAVLLGADALTALGLGASVAVPLALWLSTWAQAAVVRAALFEESLGPSLSRSWAMTGGFSWVLCLCFLAAGGGFFLLILPGLLLSALLFFAPVYQMSGEAEGLRALELSWARVRPRLPDAGMRIVLVVVIVLAPGWIPYIGWLVAPFWAPFGVVATARLARDLRDAAAVGEPPRLGTAVALLSLVFALGTAVSGRQALQTYRSVRRAVLEGGLFSEGIDEETGRALIAVLSGQATEDQARRALAFARARSPFPP